MNPKNCSSVPSYFKSIFASIASAGHAEDLPVDLARPSIFSEEPKQPVVYEMSEVEGLSLGVHID